MKIVFSQNDESYKKQRNRAFFQQLLFRKIFDEEDKVELSFDLKSGINVLVVKNTELYSRLYSSLVGTGLDVEISLDSKFIALMGSKPKFPRPLYRSKLSLIYYFKMVFGCAKIKDVIAFVDELMEDDRFQEFFKDITKVSYLELSFLFLSRFQCDVDTIFVSGVDDAQRVREYVAGNVKIVALVKTEKNIRFAGHCNKIRIYDNLTISEEELKNDINMNSPKPVNSDELPDGLLFSVYPIVDNSHPGLNKISVEVQFENEVSMQGLNIVITINDVYHKQYVRKLSSLNKGDVIFVTDFEHLGFPDGVYTCFCSITSKTKVPLYVNTCADADFISAAPYYV